jgi:hypothetical protein
MEHWAQTEPQQPAGTVSTAVHGGHNPWRTSETGKRKRGGTKGGNLLQYSLRLKGLPPTYTSKSYQVWKLLRDMLQSASAVPVLGVYATENCLASGGRHCDAFIYVGNEDNGNGFIQDMATTRVDRGMELEQQAQNAGNTPQVASSLWDGNQLLASHAGRDPADTA